MTTLADIDSAEPKVITEAADPAEKKKAVVKATAKKKVADKAADKKKAVVKATAKKKVADKAADKKKAMVKKKADKKKVDEASDAQTAAREKFKAMVNGKKDDSKDDEDEKVEKDEKVDEAETPAQIKARKTRDLDDLERDSRSSGTHDKDMEKAINQRRARLANESFDASKLTFTELAKIVHESGGQQQIDAVDVELFAWSQRVAASKFDEGMKQEIYAGMLYERNGGIFKLHNILSESKKHLSEAGNISQGLQAWYDKFSQYGGRNGDSLPAGYVQFAINSGITTDAVENGEFAAIANKYGIEQADENIWDHIDAGECPITSAMFDELAAVTGTNDLEKNAQYIMQIPDAGFAPYPTR